VSKHQGKLSKGIFFLQDNSAPHKAAIMQKILTDFNFEVLKHPALTPSGYYLFHKLKKHFK
jgi:hypothetical protein